MQKYGEVGVVRFLSSVGTQIEILANLQYQAHLLY